MRDLKNKKGFSLLEILVAVAILAISMVVILDMHGQSMIRSGRAEDITVGTMLTQLKLSEIQLDLEKSISKGEMPSDDKELEGSFDAPYEQYKWKASIKKVEIPVPPQPGAKDMGGEDKPAEGATATAPEGETQKAGSESLQMDIFYTMFKTISEEIAKVARSITVTVAWEEIGVERTVSATTHVIKLQ